MRFWLSGNHENSVDIIFVTSRHRIKTGIEYLFHRNDYTTFITIPKSLRSRICYERSSGIYRTDITFSELKSLGMLRVERI